MSNEPQFLFQEKWQGLRLVLFHQTVKATSIEACLFPLKIKIAHEYILARHQDLASNLRGGWDSFTKY
jgi:hypothetical protein